MLITAYRHHMTWYGCIIVIWSVRLPYPMFHFVMFAWEPHRYIKDSSVFPYCMGPIKVLWKAYMGPIWESWGQCLKLSKKSCRSSCLESQIINIKLKKNQHKVSGPPPKLLASDWQTCGNFQHCLRNPYRHLGCVKPQMCKISHGHCTEIGTLPVPTSCGPFSG